MKDSNASNNNDNGKSSSNTNSCDHNYLSSHNSDNLQRRHFVWVQGGSGDPGLSPGVPELLCWPLYILLRMYMWNFCGQQETFRNLSI